MNGTKISPERQRNRAEQIWKYHKQKVAGQRDHRQRNAIAIEHEKLVHSVCHEFTGKCPLDYQDLYQIGMLGLLKATEKFNPMTGVAFSSFALPYIRGEILHHLRDHGSNVKVPRRMREANASANKIQRRWVAATGKAPTEEQIAAEMGISPQKLALVRAAIANQSAMPLLDEVCEIPAPEAYTEDLEHLGRLERIWAQLRQNLAQLPACEQALLEQIYCVRLSQKGLAKRFQLEPEALKGKLHRVLSRIAN